MAASHRHKLDHDLSKLLEHHQWAGSARFPVVIMTSRGSVHEIADHITAEGGRIRHVMPAIHSVSAWVTVDLLDRILPLEPVVEVDLAQRTNIAAK